MKITTTRQPYGTWISQTYAVRWGKNAAAYIAKGNATQAREAAIIASYHANRYLDKTSN